MGSLHAVDRGDSHWKAAPPPARARQETTPIRKGIGMLALVIEVSLREMVFLAKVAALALLYLHRLRQREQARGAGCQRLPAISPASCPWASLWAALS